MAKSAARNANSFTFAIVEKMHVMNAVMLRDMRTRFFNHGLGFLVVPLWPLAHMAILLLLYSATGRRAPYGESVNIFFATGLIPTLLFIYVSRFMSVSLLQNRPMLAFPVVKVLDVIIARAILETMGAVLTLIFILSILWLSGDDIRPNDLDQAVLAYLAMLLLALGSGVLISVLAMASPMFATFYALLMVCVWLSSGTLFVASDLPDAVSTILSYNPVLQGVEWMRVAYFPTYSDRILDREYLVMYGLCSLCLGLIIERAMRRVLGEG